MQERTALSDPRSCVNHRAFHSRRAARLIGCMLAFAAWALALPAVTCAQPPAAPATGEKPKATIVWDWTGIIGTGQSLAVGQNGTPAVSTKQNYGNLQLSTGQLPWPIDPNNDTLKLIPLVEPIGRPSRAYPSSWPTNIAGETPHTAMADQITALVKELTGKDFVSIHTEVGENGQGMPFIKKNPTQRGVNGHAFEGSMVETKAITRLAKAAGKTYGVGAIILTHGESDAGNAQYEAQMYQLLQDYNADVAAITGQTQKIILITSQQNTSGGNPPVSTIAEWKIGLDHPGEAVCSGPKYQYASRDNLHCLADGYQQLGEKYGQIYFERVILGHDWQPLQPTKVERSGAKLTITFHVPAKPLVFDANYDPPHQESNEWKNGKGFEVRSADGRQRVTINSAEISGGTVVLTCAADPGPGAHVSYVAFASGSKLAKPFTGFTRWGLLHDSDPLIGADSKKPQPNWAVAFDMTAP